jgi:O-antigen ligase
VCGGLLLLAVASACSLAWAPSAERALLEVDRVTLFAAAFALVALAVPRSAAPAIVDGLALGLVGVALVALAGRLFPSLRPAQSVQLVPALGSRLSYPLGYWNGLGILVALALPLLLVRSIRSARWLAGVPPVAAVVVLSASRSAAVVAVVGALACLALARSRGAHLGASAVAAGSALATSALLRDRPQLLDDPLRPAAHAQGHSAALLLGALAVAGPVVLAAARGLGPYGRPRFLDDRRVRRGAALAGVLALLVVALSAHPVALAHTFARAPDLHASSDPQYVQRHLLEGSGSGRWQLWQAAGDELAAHPLGGGGAGSYAAWWARRRPFALPSAYAHSFYLQTAAELGLLGIAALLCLALAAGWAIRGRLRELAGDARTDAGALAALVVAFAVGLAVDWMWELTVVPLVALVALGVLLGRAPAGERTQRGLRPGARVAVAAGLLALGAVQAVPFLADARLRASERADAAGHPAAAYRAALDARTLAPWATSPRLQLALLDEQSGRLALAARDSAGALARDPLDWRLWLVEARIAGERSDAGRRRAALRRLEQLDPLDRALWTAAAAPAARR